MKKTFRIFISSTFNDFKTERNVLHKEIFPEVKKYCKSIGFAFQAIDLRWGINNEAQKDQKTLPMCLAEVANCKAYPHPNFIIFLGSRYGWIPLPFMIEKLEFEEILKNTNKRKELMEWYFLDENQIPSSYILKPRTGKFENYNIWEKKENELREILLKASKNLVDVKNKKYITSATHHEFEEILKGDDNRQYIISVIRDIEGENINEKDVINFRNEVKKEIAECNQITHKVKELKQIDGGIAYEIIDKEKFVKDIKTVLIKNIDHEISRMKKESKNIDHENFKNSKIDIFFGRKNSLDIINNYINNEEQTPFYIYSDSGMGKSALMAKAINNQEEQNNHKKIIYRFVGASADSLYKKDLLVDIANELTGQIIDYKYQEHEFDKQIKKVLEQNQECKTIVFIDALDQIKTRDYLKWLPQNLGKNLKIVLTVLKDENFKEDSIYYDILSEKYGTKNSLDLNHDSLKANADEIFSSILAKYNRTLTQTQMILVKNKFYNANCSPLYAYIVSQELRNVSSKQSIDIADNISGAINEFVDNLVKIYHHNEIFIRKVLSLIAFSKYGISESEIFDILSEDLQDEEEFQKAILNNFHEPIKAPNPLRKDKEELVLPAFLWSSLSNKLEPFFVKTQKDGEILINFFHRQFKQSISKLYEAYKIKTHERILNYFNEFEQQEKLWNERYPSLRALSEIFYHLYYSKSERLDEYLNNLEFIGSIYDHGKENDFREILDILDEKKYWVIKSFYREKDYLIKSVVNEKFKPHMALFQVAYEDGVDSPLNKGANDLIDKNKINFRWLKRENIDYKFSRSGLINVLLNENNSSNIMFVDKDTFITYNGPMIVFWSLQDFNIINTIRTKICETVIRLSDGNLLSYRQGSSTFLVFDKKGIIKINKDIEKDINFIFEIDTDMIALQLYSRMQIYNRQEDKFLEIQTNYNMIEKIKDNLYVIFSSSLNRIVKKYYKIAIVDKNLNIIKELDIAEEYYSVTKIFDDKLIIFTTKGDILLLNLIDYKITKIDIGELQELKYVKIIRYDNERIVLDAKLNNSEDHILAEIHENKVNKKIECANITPLKNGNYIVQDDKAMLFLDSKYRKIKKYNIPYKDTPLNLEMKNGNVAILIDENKVCILDGNGEYLKQIDNIDNVLSLKEFEEFLVIVDEKYIKFFDPNSVLQNKISYNGDNKFFGSDICYVSKLKNKKVFLQLYNEEILLFNNRLKLKIKEDNVVYVKSLLETFSENIIIKHFDTISFINTTKMSTKILETDQKTNGIISIKGHRFLSYRKDGLINLYDHNGEKLKTIKAHLNSIELVKQLKNKNFVSCTKYVGKIWDQNFELLHTFEMEKDNNDFYYNNVEVIDNYIWKKCFDYACIYNFEGKIVKLLKYEKSIQTITHKKTNKKYIYCNNYIYTPSGKVSKSQNLQDYKIEENIEFSDGIITLPNKEEFLFMHDYDNIKIIRQYNNKMLLCFGPYLSYFVVN
ncbi:DUF4062 domain-containing protein [Campylobacter concisus]|uniref:DUF4062 domain-containing protein n=1 Tax=Campylobacter concisus TaxID=199 RepID=UPI000D313A44|nr:DUF4062 domain-containing protein [Campylobacter concisus]